jgi:hypothetical protein
VAQPTITIEINGKDGDPVEFVLPAKFDVCPRCEGHGSHTNPSIDGNGITSDEMEELGEDFREDYMRGVYDVTCSLCHGEKVVPVPHVARWSFAQKRAFVQHRRDEIEYQRDYDSERRLRMAESGERW